jgi:hypothetical protein
MRERKPLGLGLVLAAGVLAASFIGCPLLKKKQPADDDSTSAEPDAATVAAAGLGAKNEASVLRYANETPLSNEPAVIGASGAKARNFPGNGPEVAFLPKGTPVAKIAQYFSTGTLIMFDDPSGDGSKLIGWVTPTSFDVASPAPTKVIVPPRVDAGAVTVKDGGARPPTQDAGSSTAVKDAGAAPIVDAGSSAIPQPPKGSLAVPPTNGKCPDGWALTEGMCRRKCAADSECPRGTKCVTKQSTKVCSSS